MIGKTDRQVNQDIGERYGDKAAEGATSNLQGDDEFDKEDNNFESARAEENVINAARAEESAARSHFQR